MKNQNTLGWFKVEILNCKLEANSSRPRRQIHQIAANSIEEARELTPRVFSFLFGADTYIGTVETFLAPKPCPALAVQSGS